MKATRSRRVWIALAASASIVVAGGASAQTAAAAGQEVQDRPLRLEDAVQLALSRNERAKIADQQVAVAEAAVESAHSRFLPTIVVNGNDTQRPYSNTDATGRTTQPSNVATAQASINQPLLNASAWPLLRQSQRLLDAQRATAADQKLLLAYDAATAFFQTLSVQHVLEAAQKRLDTAKANLADTQARVAAQLASSNDVTRATLDLASAEQEVAVDQGNVRRQYLALSFLLNAPVAGPLVPPQGTMQAAATPLAPAQNLVALAESKRLDLVASRHQAHAAHLFADEPLLRTVPTIGLQGNVSTTTNTPVSGRATDESLALTFTWTLYDAGVRYADKHSRDAQAAIADLQQQQLVRSVANDVLTAINALQAAQAERKASAEAVGASERSAQETAELYRQGLAKALELTDANDARFLAEVAYANSELTMTLAYLALRSAMGLDPLGTELR